VLTELFIAITKTCFMNIIRESFKDRLFAAGLVMIVMSFAIFCLTWFIASPGETGLTLFALHFGISLVYYFVLLINRKRKPPEFKRHYRFLLLLLFLISAYALNREMDVFSTSPVWLCVLIMLISFNYIASFFFTRMKRWMQFAVLFLLGVSTVFFIYLSFYLLPLYGVSIIGLLVLGISIHAFIPAIFTYNNLLFVSGLAGNDRRNWISYTMGIAMPVLIAVVFTIAWSTNVNDINKIYKRALADGNAGLPVWVNVAQHTNVNAITGKILKSGLVYTVPEWQGNLFFRMPGRSWGEFQKVHDPLVVIASVFSDRLHLSDDEKIDILNSEFRTRHHSEERLWSGKDLATTNVVSRVRIWPESHIAYTEKIITVCNYLCEDRFSNNQQEAIYTFHLPEGAVVTSLSLWINGVEEKSILTTKEQAQEAYRTIVGVEYRDPSVVHWQEGNQVTVRVFPVNCKEPRVFKVGITSPLRKEEETLVYDNIWFEGPDASSAEESVDLRVSGRETDAAKQAVLSDANNKNFRREGRYRQQWSYKLKDEGLFPQFFSFNGNRYLLKPYTRMYESVAFQNIYLDLNASWSKAEFEKLWEIVKNRNVWVYYHASIKLTEDNRQEYFNKLRAQRFSLFPVFTIHDPQLSLLITKSASHSPGLSDLTGSGFLNELKKYSEANRKLRVYNIGHELSPYLASLKDYRLFNYDRGDLIKLQQFIAQNQFVTDIETDNEIVIHNAEVTIARQPGNGEGKGPDHLQRLFAYNHILQQYGRGGLGKNLLNDSLVNEAKEANVVSPVSSLIVLETKEDYENFGIERAQHSLGNASLKNAAKGSSGAVPEPHEWVLIILTAGIGLYLLVKARFF
jgi:XrtN system VIT domain protein